MGKAEQRPRLASVAAEAFERRRAVGLTLMGMAETVARACHGMAQRFHRGGKLIAFGNGAASTDAQHVAVEFVHPVIVGKRALPAFSLTNDVASLTGIAGREGWEEVFAQQLSYLARPQDIALGICQDGRDRNVLRGIEVAKERGLLTIALTGGDSGPLAASAAVDHCLLVRAEDATIVKELQVTVYHILWELVHVFIEQPGVLEETAVTSPKPNSAGAGGIESLYPFLYAGKGDIGAVLTEVRRSIEEKAREIAALRERVGSELRGRLVECAVAMSGSFSAGGKLFAFGNGGSATDAQALVQLFLHPPSGGPLPALSLTNDTAVLTALSNDVGFEVVFARPLAAFGTAGDVAVGISTSGNSANVLRAFDEAARRGLLTVGFAGYDGGKMAEMESIAYLFVVPSVSVHRIQEAQATLYHMLWELTQEARREATMEGSARRKQRWPQARQEPPAGPGG